MNRQQLFLSTAKVALASAFGGTWLAQRACAQTAIAGQDRKPFVSDGKIERVTVELKPQTAGRAFR